MPDVEKSAPRLSKSDSAMIHLGVDKLTAFERHKALFYTLRVTVELLHSLIIAFAVFTFFSQLFRAYIGHAFTLNVMFPGMSSSLDKTVAHWLFVASPWTHIITGEYDAIESMQVFDADFNRVSSNDWKGAGNDAWWCLEFKHGSAMAVHEDNGVCATPSWLNSTYNVCHNGLRAETDGAFNMLGPRMKSFPSGDSGWGCVVPGMPAFPSAAQTAGECYSICIDVVGTSPWANKWMPLDAYQLFLVPFWVDFVFILVFIHKNMLFEGYWHDIPIKRRLGYLLASLPFYGIAGVAWTTGFGTTHLFFPDGLVTGIIAIVVAQSFVGLALESKNNPFGRFVRCFVYPFYRISMWMLDMSTQEDSLPKWDICSGEALCFYLVDAYAHIRPPRDSRPHCETCH